MDAAEPTDFPFLVVGTGPAGLRLRALHAWPPGGPLRVYCRGIEVGSLAQPSPVAADAILDIPIARLPCVALPALLRLAAAPEGPELAAPWPLATPAVALALFGPAAPVLEDLRLEHGMLRGTGVERVNGLLQPFLHAVINGTTARAVQVEPPVPLAEGGCAFRFAMPLEAADLTGSGLSITLHAPGVQAALAHFAWGPALPGAERMAEFEARLLRLEQAGQMAQAAGQAALDHRLDLQQDRIDAFIDAAASLLLDRLAGAGPQAAPEALRALIAAAATNIPAEPAAPAEGSRVAINPRDAAFDLGWHGAEEDDSGGFRWMTMQGLVRNPAPLRPVAGVTVEIGHLYGAPSPSLEAGFDAMPCVVEAERRGPHHFRLRITPPDGPAACRLLRLQALTGGRPADDGASEDARVLSYAITRLTFDYAG